MPDDALRPPRPLTAAAVALRLACSTKTVVRFCERGCLGGAFRVGAHWRIPASAVDAYLERRGSCPSCPASPTCPASPSSPRSPPSPKK